MSTIIETSEKNYYEKPALSVVNLNQADILVTSNETPWIEIGDEEQN